MRRFLFAPIRAWLATRRRWKERQLSRAERERASMVDKFVGEFETLLRDSGRFSDAEIQRQTNSYRFMLEH